MPTWPEAGEVLQLRAQHPLVQLPGEGQLWGGGEVGHQPGEDLVGRLLPPRPPAVILQGPAWRK